MFSLLNCLVLILILYMQFLSLRCYFRYLNIIWTLTLPELSQSVYFFTTSISHGVENYFPRLWGTAISDAIFNALKFMKSCTKSHNLKSIASIAFC